MPAKMASESRDPSSSTAPLPALRLDMPLPMPDLSIHSPGADDDEQLHSRPLEHADRNVPSRHDHDHLRNRHRTDVNEKDQNISIPASNKQLEMTIAPFLTKHIPTQYNPVGNASSASAAQEPEEASRNSTKYCYRHRPDLKCRRQANEPSMDQLQNELATLSQADQQAISHVWSFFSAAPAKYRNLMLQGILTQCCFPQLSFIAANVRDLIKIDFLAALPAELSFNILCFLDTTSLCKAAQVSRRWRSLADDDVVWHKMCEQHIDRKCVKCGWGLPLLEKKRLRLEKRQIQLRATGRGLNQWSPDIAPIPEEHPKSGVKRSLDQPAAPTNSKRQCTQASRGPGVVSEAAGSYFVPKTRPWKDVYKDRFKVGTAWKHGRCTTKILKGHTNGVTCLQFDDNILISGSYDTTIKVWDITTGEEIRTLSGHTNGIRCLQFDDRRLMTGSMDSTLKVWNYKTGECTRTLHAHTDGIIALHFTKRWIATGSKDRTIRMYDQEKGGTFLLKGHEDWVNSVKVDEPSRTVFSSSDDLTIRLWDLDTRRCIKVFEGHVGQVQQITLLPADFELDSDDPRNTPAERDDDASSVSSATVTNDLRRASISTLSEPFWPNNPQRPAPPKYMLTGALDSTIRLWNTHFPPQSQSFSAGATSAPWSSQGEILPTDPLTNSHVPRAQACVRTFFGHVEGIWALSADHLRLVSGSEDRMMKIWDPRTGKCERTFTGHQGPVTCTWLGDSRVASGSEDCEVRVLCFGDG